MIHIKLKSVTSGLILGYIIETVIIEGQVEYVVQTRQGRMFVKPSDNLILTQ